MTLDKEAHRSMLLEMLNNIQLPGSAIDAAYELRQAILRAEVVQSPEE